MGGTGEHEGGHSVARVGDVLFGADWQVAKWVSDRIPGFTASTSARALGVVKKRSMAAGVVFENWNGVHIEAAIAAEPGTSWASRRTLHTLFYYPFVTLNCRAISVSVPETNLPSLNLAMKLGFDPEALIRFAAHDGSTLIIMKQFRETCKWIGDYGEKRRQCAKSTRSPEDGSSGSAVQPA